MSLRWSVCTATDVGKVRKVNEDSFLDRSDAGLWVVADGMGGHAAGDVASRMVVEALSSSSPDASLPALADELEQKLEAVNAELIKLAKDTRKKTIGCTVVAFAIRGNHGLVAWAGDSRLYRLRGDHFECLTQDHALVEELVTVGLLSRAEAEKHPQANRITRAVGAGEPLFVDFEIYSLKPGDRFLLCSDGLYKEVDDAGIRGAMAKRPADNPARFAVERALSGGGRDNVTVITIEIN
jgi:protein phosphatase